MFYMGAGFNLASKQYCLGSLDVTVLRVATVWTLIYPLLESYVILLTAFLNLYLFCISHPPLTFI